LGWNVVATGGTIMKKDKTDITSIDGYIKTFPMEVQKKLKGLRQAIKIAAPEAQERISYGMPAFYLKGNLIYFAAYQNHIGLYPTPNGIRAFQKELSKFKGAKGSVQFPMDEPLPLALIGRIVKYRVLKNTQKVRG
jgi:uncharacterized protein YdhG (YjbR/CyaY superfamily)